jgi:hypothetical protein
MDGAHRQRTCIGTDIPSSHYRGLCPHDPHHRAKRLVADTYQALKLRRREVFHLCVFHLEPSQYCRTMEMGLLFLHSPDEGNPLCFHPFFG